MFSKKQKPAVLQQAISLYFSAINPHYPF